YEASTSFHDMFYPGGAFALYSALSWAINSHHKTDLAKWPSQQCITGGADGFPAIDSDRRILGKAVPFFRDWMTHTSRDSYWADIDGTDRCQDLKAPVQLMAGWYDPFLPTQLRDFAEIRRSSGPAVAQGSRLIIGPWTHGREITFADGSKPEKF